MIFPIRPFIAAIAVWALYFLPNLTFPWWPKGRKGHAISYACGGFDISLGLAYAHLCLRGSVDPTGWSGGLLAAALLLGVELGFWTSMRVGLERPTIVWQPVEQLIYFIVFIGFAEELWFRGICFAQFPGRPWMALCVSSALFGMMHFNHGLGSVISAALAGVAFGLARHYGSSILALAVVHGLVDYLNSSLLPARSQRSLGAGLACYAATLALLVIVGHYARG